MLVVYTSSGYVSSDINHACHMEFTDLETGYVSSVHIQWVC